MLGYLLGLDVLIVGVEDDPDEPHLTRVYFAARYRGIYVLCEGEDAERVKRVWRGGQHVTMRKPGPDDPVYQTPEGKAWDERAMAARR
jgi:hypothetical protein